MGNTFGHLLRLTTFGESHGAGIGLVLDGCPARLPLTEEEIQVELDRRRPGQSALVTPRQEADRARILAGVFEGNTLGSPIHVFVANQDQRSRDYSDLKDLYRPSHADFTYEKKYGIRDHRGGGRASARETIARVAAGVVARKVLATAGGIEIVAYVRQVHAVRAAAIDVSVVHRDQVEANAVRCPDPEAAARMIAVIEEARDQRDSVGGIIEFVARGVPVGLGEPVFSKLDAELGRALLSIPATKGVEFGEGFGAVALFGSEHNDAFRKDATGAVITETNRSGGIQGGISNGQPIVGRVAFKPTATIGKSQKTVDRRGQEVEMAARGRHDPCVLPRAVPIVEAMIALTLADHLLLQRARG
jgi:chorismate synthase